jgi:hypothetical protein
MSAEKDFFLAELVGDSNDVGDKFRQSVRGHASGLAPEVVAALIWDDDSKSGGSQRFDLAVPAIPEFRKAVEKHHYRAVLRPGSNGVQAYGSALEKYGFHEIAQAE